MKKRARVGLRSPVLAAALALLLSGCSFMTVTRPPAVVEDPRVADPCTTSVQAPVADTILAGASLVAAYVAFVVAVVDSADKCSGQTGSPCNVGSEHVNGAPALALVGAGALFGSSAAYGFVGTHQCKRRTSLTWQCADGNLGACRRVVPGWTPPANLLPPPAAPRPAAPPPSAAPPPPAAAPPPAGTGGQGWIDVPVGPTPPPPEPGPR